MAQTPIKAVTVALATNGRASQMGSVPGLWPASGSRSHMSAKVASRSGVGFAREFTRLLQDRSRREPLAA